MSFLAKLMIDGNEYTVLDHTITFEQCVDSLERPHDLAHDGRLRITLEADRTNNFMTWAISTGDTRDGELVYYRRDAMSTLTSIKFFKAHCTYFDEHFVNATSTPMIVTIEVVAKSIDAAGIQYDRSWSTEA